MAIIQLPLPALALKPCPGLLKIYEPQTNPKFDRKINHRMRDQENKNLNHLFFFPTQSGITWCFFHQHNWDCETLETNKWFLRVVSVTYGARAAGSHIQYQRGSMGHTADSMMALTSVQTLSDHLLGSIFHAGKGGRAENRRGEISRLKETEHFCRFSLVKI